MKTNKKIAMVITIVLAVMLILSTKTQASYQCIGTGTSITGAATTWITGIRNMEATGNGMGLSEVVGTDGLATTDSNNIDVHMLKNTEYGAAVLLGASDYGKQGTDITSRRMDQGATTGIEVQASSTGNRYGVYELGYYNMDISSTGYEWTAGGNSKFLPTIASRYVNIYTTSTDSAIRGDATIETKGWHSSSSNEWINREDYSRGFLRGKGGSFSYYGYYQYMATHAAKVSGYSRPAIVMGEGF